jgi:hypothetical protein
MRNREEVILPRLHETGHLPHEVIWLVRVLEEMRMNYRLTRLLEAKLGIKKALDIPSNNSLNGSRIRL